MKLRNLLLSAILIFTSYFTYGQNVQVYSENFEAGPGLFLLNTAGVGTNSGNNEWIVNNSFVGGGIYPNTISQDSTFGGSISFAPFSHYLHIYDIPSGYTDCLYNPANLSDRFTCMGSGICTMGLDSVSLNFFYLCQGSASAYGTVYYSRNSGPWIQCGAAQYNNKYKWQYATISNPNFGNTDNLRFGFRWQNNAGGGKDTSAFGIDDIEVVGNYDSVNHPVNITCTVTPDTVCADGGGYVFLTINLSDTLCDGNYTITLSDSNGNFAHPQAGWSVPLFYPQTSAGPFLLTIPSYVPAGHCYKIMVTRASPPPVIYGVATGCIVIKNCKNTITTLQPLVTTDPLNPVCAGSVIQVPFWSTGTYGTYNTYFAELSDSAGNFVGYPGDTIGSWANNAAWPSTASPPVPGVVSGSLPFNIPASCDYYIRVVSDTPHTYGAPFGPFCIQHCDIYTDSSNSVQACIKSCYKGPAGFSQTLDYTIHKYDSNAHYLPGNKFEVQILSTQTFGIVNTGGLGVKVDTLTGTMTIHVPCGDSLCNILHIPPAAYYMRVIATKSTMLDSMLGTLVFLNIGLPQDSLVIVPNDNTSTYCLNSTAIFLAYPYDPCTNNWSNSTYSWYDNNFNFPGVTGPEINILFNGPGSFALGVVENNNGCKGPLDTFRVHVKGPPSVAIAGPTNLCLGDTGVYSVPFSNNNYYRWTAKYSSSVDTANNILKVKYDSVGRFKITIFALDSCGEDSSFKLITIKPIPTVAIVPKADSVCLGVPVTFTASGGTSYKWSTGVTSASITVTPASNTNYWVTASNGFCSSPKDTAKLTIYPLAVGTSGDDTTIIKGGIANIFVKPTVAGQTYVWVPDSGLACDTCPATVASPNATTQYVVYITTVPGGCSKSDTVTVIVKENCGHVWVPDAFSPNGDGQNDVFYVKANPACVTSMDLTIYDRWGNLVFESKDPNTGWDGTYKGLPMNTGTYVYYVNVFTTDNKFFTQKGNITLVR
jgi:gliding motility-associated-like protein